MKRSIWIFSLLILQISSFSQSKPELIYKYQSKSDSFHYSKTDFSLVDTLNKWCFSIIANYNPSRLDSTHPLCNVRFTRTEFLSDSLGYYEFKKQYPNNSSIDSSLIENIQFKPNITFKVYQLKDSTLAFRISRINIRATSCIPPYGGGDMFIVGKFIFVNDALCLSCSSAFLGKIDYCRPLLNFIFTNIRTKNATTVEGLLNGLPIKQCN